MDKQVKIYSLSCPIDLTIKYIGKTINSLNYRLSGHIADSRKGNSKITNWIRHLRNSGLYPIIELVDICDISDWQEQEKFYISYFKFLGFNLINSTIGGGANMTEATKNKLRQYHLKRIKRTKHPFKRMKKSDSNFNKTFGRVLNPNSDGRVRHNKSNTTEYRIWRDMISRCYNSKRWNYKYYGGRGIFICQTWRDSFQNFLNDVGLRPSLKHTLDRINNDDGYYKQNCRWVTQKEQRANSRPSSRYRKPITYNGQTMLLKDWAKYLGHNYHTLSWRIGFCKMTFEEAINKPFRKSPTYK